MATGCTLANNEDPNEMSQNADISLVSALFAKTKSIFKKGNKTFNENYNM